MAGNRLNKMFYALRVSLAIVLFALTTFTFSGVILRLHNILYLQLGPLIAKFFTTFSIAIISIILFILLLTFIFGRFYCSIICPFGLLQDFIGTIFGRKTGKTPNFYKTRYLIATIIFGLLIGGSTIGLKLLDPYTNFGLILSNFLNSSSPSSLIHAVLILFIISILVIFKNRIFCTTICPVGTLLGLCAKHGMFKLNINSDCAKCGKCEKECPAGCIDSNKIDNERCTRCLRCTANCAQQAIKYEKTKTEGIKFNTSRRTFILGCAFLGTALASIKAGSFLSKSQSSHFKKLPICPPGSGLYNEFSSKCTSCNLCVTNCKGKVLKSPDFDYDTVHLDFNAGNCKYNCNLCGQICPTGAIKKLSLKEKQHCRIGIARLDDQICIGCGGCIVRCPTGALKKSTAKAPDFNVNLCIGCGACENSCPVRAVRVDSLGYQAIIDI